MKCYYHPEQEIVATCTECGRGLCKACASKWEPILCDDCAKLRIDEKRVWLKRSVDWSFGLLIAGVVIGLIMAIQDKRADNFLLCMELAFAAVFIINGWQSLSRIQPQMFLILPVVGWMFYFGFKAMLSMFVGVVVFPINVYRFWKGSREADELEAQIKR